MSGETKKRIPEVALALFSQKGYAGTSMSDIAKQLGITKPALYKHYAGKHEILERIVELMNETDYARAEEYEMPETEPDILGETYMNTPLEKIRAYSMAQFRYWTKDEFPRAIPENADDRAVPRRGDGAAVSELSCHRSRGTYGGDLPEYDRFGRCRHAACFGALRSDASALQRLRRSGKQGSGI